MTSYEQIIALAADGLSNRTISDRVGCRIEYVRVVKRRAGLAKAKPRRITRHQRIVALVNKGLTDLEVAAELTCSKHYVRVVRQRAGLHVPRNPHGATEREEAKLARLIVQLQAKLDQANDALKCLRQQQHFSRAA